MYPSENRAMVTGIGVLAANGIGVPSFWETLVAGRSGVAPITLFDASSMRCRIAAEVKGFDPQLHLRPEVKWKRMARHTQFAMAALEMALADAKLSPSAFARDERICVAMGVSTSAMEIFEEGVSRVQNGEHGRLPPWLVAASQPNAVTAAMAAFLGPCQSLATVSTACQAGLDSLLVAADMIRVEKADIAIAGGTDAPIAATTVASFGAARGMLSTRNEDPAHASRPFDRDRNGGVLGEGAGVMVIESLAHARARGARPWLEICGGASFPDPRGSPTAAGLGVCMALALANARLRPEEIDYVCAHGPSDPLIDHQETLMLRETLGRHAYHRRRPLPGASQQAAPTPRRPPVRQAPRQSGQPAPGRQPSGAQHRHHRRPAQRIRRTASGRAQSRRPADLPALRRTLRTPLPGWPIPRRRDADGRRSPDRTPAQRQ